MSKNAVSKKIVVSKKMLCQNNVVSKKNVCRKNFVLKKCCVKKFPVPRNFLGPKTFGLKKKLVHISGLKKFGPKQFWVQKNWSQKEIG